MIALGVATEYVAPHDVILVFVVLAPIAIAAACARSCARPRPSLIPAGQAGMKRWMARLALSWKAAFPRSGKMSAWSATGPVTVLAALA
jgi:hypothetical protein